MSALTKVKMADEMFESTALSKLAAKQLVNDFFELVAASLERNEPVKLSGFGGFELRDKRERPGRNPKTGEMIPVAARRVVTFRPGRDLRERVAELPT